MSVSRRSVLLAAMFALTAFSAFGAERTILRLYTWNDYFDLGVLAAFEEKYDCVVAIDTFDSNEAMLENITKGDGDKYDLVTPSAYMAAIMLREQLLLPLDHGLLPNLGNVAASFAALTEDPHMGHSVPYTRTVTGVGYNNDALGEPEPSWSIFDRSDLAGRLTMLDDSRETIGAALKYLGHSLNTTNEDELGEAVELLRRWRKNLHGFEVDESNIGLGGGKYLAAHGYNGDIAVLMEENAAFRFFVPREGSAVTADVFVVLTDSRHGELAHHFIDHMLHPDNAAANMTGILYYMPVPKALAKLDPAILENGTFTVPDEILAKCEMIRYLGPDNAKYEAAWEQIKAGEEER